MVPELLGDVDVGEVLLHRVVGLHGRVGVDVAHRAVVVGDDLLDPVVDPPHHHVGGEDGGHRAVLEGDVHHREVLDVAVVAPDVPFVAEARQPRQGRPCGPRRTS